jgi:hypothetical protein
MPRGIFLLFYLFLFLEFFCGFFFYPLPEIIDYFIGEFSVAIFLMCVFFFFFFSRVRFFYFFVAHKKKLLCTTNKIKNKIAIDGKIKHKKGLIGLLSSAGVGDAAGPHHHGHPRHHLPPLGDLVSLGLVNPTSG